MESSQLTVRIFYGVDTPKRNNDEMKLYEPILKGDIVQTDIASEEQQIAGFFFRNLKMNTDEREEFRKQLNDLIEKDRLCATSVNPAYAKQSLQFNIIIGVLSKGTTINAVCMCNMTTSWKEYDAVIVNVLCSRVKGGGVHLLNAVIDFCKSRYPIKNIQLESVFKAIGFYHKQGFQFGYPSSIVTERMKQISRVLSRVLSNPRLNVYIDPDYENYMALMRYKDPSDKSFPFRELIKLISDSNTSTFSKCRRLPDKITEITEEWVDDCVDHGIFRMSKRVGGKRRSGKYRSKNFVQKKRSTTRTRHF